MEAKNLIRWSYYSKHISDNGTEFSVRKNKEGKVICRVEHRPLVEQLINTVQEVIDSQIPNKAEYFNKEEAIRKMNLGEWVRHTYFLPYEFITIDPHTDKIKDGQGELTSQDLFWGCRKSKVFDYGWSNFK